MNRVVSVDAERGLVEAEAGILWSELVPWLRRSQTGADRRWSIVQKQTGADRLSLGGALSANGHGRGLKLKPIIQDVESFTLIDADGEFVDCSRTCNADLFRLVVGGYGLFGVVATVRLRLMPSTRLRRVVEVFDIKHLPSAFETRIADGFIYGDFQFMTDERSDDYLRLGVFSCYRPIDEPQRELQHDNRPMLSEHDWARLIHLAHTDKTAAMEAYSSFYLGTSGQIYDIDEFQMSVYLDDYHQTLDISLNAKYPGSEMITELYVPLEHLVDFMTRSADLLRSHSANVIYGTIRLIEADDETFLNWASRRYACIVFNLHIDHVASEIERAADAFRGLIDVAVSLGGSYFLTYHRFATEEQIKSAYPQFPEFLQRKLRHDPDELFSSDWYEHYRHVV